MLIGAVAGFPPSSFFPLAFCLSAFRALFPVVV